MSESSEMYLETLYILLQKAPLVRSIDVGEYMGYSKPSVSRAVGLLKKEEFITVDDRGYIKLTKAGEKKAKTIYERHNLLSQLFVNIGVDKKTAVEDACRIEHYISQKTFNAIKKHIQKCGSTK